MGRIRLLLVATAVIAAVGTKLAVADTITLHGEAQKLGNGFVQAYTEVDAEGAPAVIGVTFDAGMLEGLPTMPNAWSRCFDKNGNGQIDPHGECHGDFELEFPLPQELAGVTPFTWVSLNWNPMGHTPPALPVWAVPHLDFHFYLMPREAVRQIRPGACAELIDCDDFVRAQMPVPAQYVHADTSTSAPRSTTWANHLIDSKTPELAPAGPPVHAYRHLRRARGSGLGPGGLGVAQGCDRPRRADRGLGDADLVDALPDDLEALLHRGVDPVAHPLLGQRDADLPRRSCRHRKGALRPSS